jgi:hypothetical protein
MKSTFEKRLGMINFATLEEAKEFALTSGNFCCMIDGFGEVLFEYESSSPKAIAGKAGLTFYRAE